MDVASEWLAPTVVQLLVIEDRFGTPRNQAVGVVKARIEDERAADSESVGVSMRDFHQEAVARGGGQLEGLLPLDAVAVGEDQQMREVRTRG